MRYRANGFVSKYLHRLCIEERRGLCPIEKVGGLHAEDVRESRYLVDGWIGQRTGSDRPNVVLAEAAETQACHVCVRVGSAVRLATEHLHKVRKLL